MNNAALQIKISVDAKQAKTQLTQLRNQLLAVQNLMEKQNDKMHKREMAAARNAQKIKDQASDARMRRAAAKERESIKTEEAAAVSRLRRTLAREKNAIKKEEEQAKAAERVRDQRIRTTQQRRLVRDRAAAVEQRKVASWAMSEQRKVDREAANEARRAAKEVDRARAAQAKADENLRALQEKNRERAAQLREKGARAGMAARDKSVAQAAVDKEKLKVAEEKAAAAAARTAAAESKATAASERAAVASEQLAQARARTEAANNRVAKSEQDLAAATSRAAQAATRAHTAATTGADQAVAAASRKRAALSREQATNDRTMMTRLRATRFLQKFNSGGAEKSVASLGERFSALSARMLKAGKDMQWLGRILETRVTLPILALGAFGTQAALSFDAAFTRVKKVYGDTGVKADELGQHLQLLQKFFFLLSDTMGIAVEDVTEVGAAWAAAGAKGTDLMRMTQFTLEAQILGDLDTQQAIDGLVSLRAAYGLTVESIDKDGNLLENSMLQALAIFNRVENETAISFGGLLEVLSKSSGIARETGVDLRHLAAMAAALVPTAGTAEEAGTMLKSTLFQIMAPTGDAAKAMEFLGISINSTAWASKNAVQRLDVIRDKVDSLSQSEKIVFVRRLSNLRQGSRFLTLLQDMASDQSIYNKALETTSDNTELLTSYQKELAAVMGSPSRQFQIFTNRIRNALIQVMIPLLPAITSVVQWLSRMATAFGNLSPRTQKIIMGLLLFAAAIGPVLAYLGTMIIMLKVVASAIVPVVKLLWTVVAAIGGWPLVIAAAVAALAALVYIFRDEIGRFFQRLGPKLAEFFRPIMPLVNTVMTGVLKIVNAGLRFLPQSFANAFIAVVNVVKTAALAVYSWLSWMNPFARHSPSLVEQVRAGTQEIMGAYRRTATDVAGSMGRVASALRALGGSLTRARQMLRDMQAKETIELAVLAGADPGAVRALIDGIDDMTASYEALGDEISAQEAVLDGWQDQIDAAEKSISAAEDVLKGLEDAVSSLDDQLSASQDRLNNWLQTPVAGTYAFEDALFSNSQAQKGLQLQIARLEQQLLNAGTSVESVRAYIDEQKDSTLALADANGELADSLLTSGMTADDVKNRMGELASEIESLRGEQLDLRMMGAGSDVLGGFDQQISLIDGTRKQLAKALGDGTVGGGSQDLSQFVPVINQIDELQKKLDELSKAGEILDLEQALALEPAQKAIEDTQRIAEKSLSEILAGIATETAATAELTRQRDAANAAVQAQQQVVDSLTASRDALQASYDIENDKLEQLQKAYDGLGDSIDYAQAQLDTFKQLGEEVKKAKEAAGNDLGPAGDFAVPGGAGAFGDGGSLADMQSIIDEMQANLDKTFGDFDPFGGLKKKWTDFKTWLSGGWNSFWSTLTGGLTGLFEKINFPSLSDKLGLDKFGGTFQTFKEKYWNPFKENVLGGIGNFVSQIWVKLGPLAEAFGELWTGIKETAQKFWGEFGDDIMRQLGVIWMIFKTQLNIVIDIFEIVWRVATEILGNFFTRLGGILGGIIEVFTGWINIIAGIMQGDWGLIWEGVKQIVSGTWEVIRNLVMFFLDSIWSIVKGGFQAIWAVITDVWNGIGVPAFNAVLNWLKTNVLQFFLDLPGKIADAFRRIPELLGNPFGSFKGILVSGLNAAIGVINTFIGGINSVASKLGIGFRIGTIGYVSAGGVGNNAMPMAAGGQIPMQEVGGGFVTNQARAIVGEGSKVYPEYVIPTDPKYRGRALKLAMAMMSDIGMMAQGGQIPTYAGGGVLGFFTEMADKAATKIWDSTVGNVRSQMGRIGGMAGDFGRGALEQLIVQTGNNIINKWLGQWWNDQKNSVLNLVGLGTSLTKSASTIKKATNGLGSTMPLASGGTVPPHIYQMANGALVKGGRGGVLAHIGEGRRDEIVSPLPSGLSAGGNTYHFYGDLSFPNIQGPGDVDEFLSNLEALSGN